MFSNKLVWLKSKLVNKLGFVLLVTFTDSTMGFITIFGSIWGICLELFSNHPPGKSKSLKGMSGLLHMIRSVVPKYNTINLDHNPMTSIPF